MNQLEALKKYSTIVVDSSDIESIYLYKPHDATTNPSLILKTTKLKIYEFLLQNAINYAKKKGGDKCKQIVNAYDKLSVNFGIEILKRISGYVSTEIDIRYSFDQHSCIKQARKIIDLYEESGINRSRVLIKIASTWEGICAAKELKKYKINCNLTLLFSFAQARACAEAGVFLISPFVGRIYDWYQEKNKTSKYIESEDMGIKSVRKIYQYYKENNYKTIIMAASFRNTNQILALSGCDRLTISPNLLEILKSNNLPIKRCLKPIKKINNHFLPNISESDFRWQHNQDQIAVEKLSEGIRLFFTDQQKIEKILMHNLL
ncbi:transaldolase [Candidatus Tachikawaea gelatinosa]|uniref:Transaldolase n=1 Tax=Candidatus Tachikawaea gelatinosa TaxID=1410383 RepID=A0A090AR39_9ENTR|nr:transaldolase [Candidatus Tachikawaea gelatinosa]BAP58817.1 transaldolase [Candidatus Tachikawaea gelatinosa]